MPLLVSVLLVLILCRVCTHASSDSAAENGPIGAAREIGLRQDFLDVVWEVLSLVE